MNTFEPPDSSSVTRRDFLGRACAAGTLIALGIPFPACRSSAPAPAANAPDATAARSSGIAIDGDRVTLDLDKPDTQVLTSPGGFLFIAAAQTIVVNVGSTIRAFTSVCTHTGCDVDRLEGDQLVCPCHDGRFSATTGQVQSGPAPAPLREYPVDHTGRVVTIRKA